MACDSLVVADGNSAQVERRGLQHSFHFVLVKHLRAQDKVILEIATQVQEQHTCYLSASCLVGK